MKPDLEPEFKWFSKLFEEMSQVDETKDYYYLSLTADKSGKIAYTTKTTWIGFADEKHHKEIREPYLVKPSIVIKGWENLGLPYLIVNKDEHYHLYCFVGGNALVEKSLIEQYMPEFLKPDTGISSDGYSFISVKSLPKHVFNRAPTARQRMQIIKRDGFRCRICGRRPTDYVDVELHVHHIRPWGKGGLTDDKNLITLCHTCHKGLDPHEDHSLFDLIEIGETLSRNDFTQEFFEGVERYQQIIREKWAN